MPLAVVGEAVVVVEEAVVELAYNMMADIEEHRMERMTPHMDSSLPSIPQACSE